MTSTILKKMQEKEKKPDKKGAPEKGMKRNNTTVNLNRSKIDKNEKGGDKDNKSRKSMTLKKSEVDKKSKPLSTSIKTEGNVKKRSDVTSPSKKEALSKSIFPP